MILKTLDYRQSRNDASVIEEWNYYDNIEIARHTYDEEVKMTTVRCIFRGGDTVTFSIPNVAYLMSDSGKTIEKIYGAEVEELGDTEEAVYHTLQDAAEAAMNNKSA